MLEQDQQSLANSKQFAAVDAEQLAAKAEGV